MHPHLRSLHTCKYRPQQLFLLPCSKQDRMYRMMPFLESIGPPLMALSAKLLVRLVQACDIKLKSYKSNSQRWEVIHFLLVPPGVLFSAAQLYWTPGSHHEVQTRLFPFSYAVIYCGTLHNSRDRGSYSPPHHTLWTNTGHHECATSWM